MADVKSDHVLPEYVKCCKCGGRPIETDWLKPVSDDPNCRVLIHISCISRDLLKDFKVQGLMR